MGLVTKGGEGISSNLSASCLIHSLSNQPLTLGPFRARNEMCWLRRFLLTADNAFNTAMVYVEPTFDSRNERPGFSRC